MSQTSLHNSQLLPFANDPPSPAKYDAAVEAASSFSISELVQERSCLLHALEIEDEASEDGYGDYKARRRMVALLELVQEKLCVHLFHAALGVMDNRLANHVGVRILLTLWQSELVAQLDNARSEGAMLAAVDRIRAEVPEVESLCRECEGMAARLRQRLDELPVKQLLQSREEKAADFRRFFECEARKNNVVQEESDLVQEP